MKRIIFLPNKLKIILIQIDRLADLLGLAGALKFATWNCNGGSDSEPAFCQTVSEHSLINASLILGQLMPGHNKSN